MNRILSRHGIDFPCITPHRQNGITVRIAKEKGRYNHPARQLFRNGKKERKKAGGKIEGDGDPT